MTIGRQVGSLDRAADDTAACTAGSYTPIMGLYGKIRDCDMSPSVSLLAHDSIQLAFLVLELTCDVRTTAVAVMNVFTQ